MWGRPITRRAGPNVHAVAVLQQPRQAPRVAALQAEGVDTTLVTVIPGASAAFTATAPSEAPPPTMQALSLAVAVADEVWLGAPGKIADEALAGADCGLPIVFTLPGHAWPVLHTRLERERRLCAPAAGCFCPVRVLHGARHRGRDLAGPAVDQLVVEDAVVEVADRGPVEADGAFVPRALVAGRARNLAVSYSGSGLTAVDRLSETGAIGVAAVGSRRGYGGRRDSGGSGGQQHGGENPEQQCRNDADGRGA